MDRDLERKSHILFLTTTGTRVGTFGLTKIEKILLAGGLGSGSSLFLKLTCGSESCPWEVQKTVSQRLARAGDGPWPSELAMSEVP